VSRLGTWARAFEVSHRMSLVNDFDDVVSVSLIMLTHLTLILGWHILKKTLCACMSNKFVSIAICKRILEPANNLYRLHNQ
jgi:hypothetical protein